MKKILIVEDQQDVQRLLEVVFKVEGLQAFLAEKGEEAIRIAREVRPNVILMDVMQPGKIDGFDNVSFNQPGILLVL